MMRRFIFCTAIALAACAPDNGLGGSVGELFPLEVSRVEVYRNESALQVTYYRNRDTFLDVVVRVSVSLRSVEVKNGAKIDLAGEYEPGHARTSVAHAPGGEPVRVFPRVKRGDMVIDQVGAEGQISRGNFSMVFDSMGGDLGQGRTLTGTFAATTFDAGFGPLP